MNPLSLTSNTTKLLHHLDHLRRLQQGRAGVIQLVITPTNRCNAACPSCCFRDRDKGLELGLEAAKRAVDQLRALGLKAVELSGGGDPTLWGPLPEFVGWCTKVVGLPVGMCTNGLDASPSIPWRSFAWVRISLNPIRDPKLRARWFDNAPEIVEATPRPSGGYVAHFEGSQWAAWHREQPWPEVDDVGDAAEALGLPTRLAADARRPKDEVARTLRRLASWQATRGTQWTFVSDFNTPLEAVPRTAPCRGHLLKPLLAADGWLYACPSFELSPENPPDFDPRFRLCHGDDAAMTYAAVGTRGLPHACSFCKYADHNELLHQALTEVTFEQFV